MEAWFICKQTVSSPAKMFPGSLLGIKCWVGGKTAFWGGGQKRVQENVSEASFEPWRLRRGLKELKEKSLGLLACGL